MTNFDYKKFLAESKATFFTKLNENASNVAEKFAQHMSKKEGKKFTVTPGSVDEKSFDLDVDGEKYMGGSYLVKDNGDIVNVAMSNKVSSNVNQLEEGDLMKNIGKGLDYESTEEMIRDYASGLFGDTYEPEDLADFYLQNPSAFPKSLDHEFFKNNYDDILSLAMTGLDEGKAAYEYEEGKKAGEAIEKKKMKKSELKAKIKEMILAEQEDEEEAEVEATDDVTTGDEEVDTTVDVSTDDVDPNVKAVQDALTQAQAAAQDLGDPKLSDQIGNTITFFTRSHVVKKPGGAVAEESVNLKENLLLQKRAGIINESQYKAKLKEVEEVSPEQAVSKAIDVVPKLEKSPEMDKLADKIANDPKMLQQLEKALAKGGIMMNENMEKLDNSDLKTLALNFAKKADAMNEGISNDPGSDDVSAGITMAAFVGGGTLGASLSSIIGAVIPAATTIFAGPALVGAAAGVGLWLLARKVYLKMNPDV
jgi:hypothetical protein